MRNKEPSSRIVCEAKCLLSFDELDLEGVIENLSLSGALIKLNDKTPNNIQPGDNCDLMFNSDQDLYPIKYTSKVVRVDLEIIGVQFLELNIM
jgi:c-di-GMP-binding flagellar brake protein YcgR